MSGYQRLSPGMYRGPNGQLVRSQRMPMGRAVGQQQPPMQDMMRRGQFDPDQMAQLAGAYQPQGPQPQPLQPGMGPGDYAGAAAGFPMNPDPGFAKLMPYPMGPNSMGGAPWQPQPGQMQNYGQAQQGFMSERQAAQGRGMQPTGTPDQYKNMMGQMERMTKARSSAPVGIMSPPPKR